MPVNITGRPRTATAINGQIPAPILRWREGDTITLAVTNRLSEPTSIHWHGSHTVADGRRAGFELSRHTARPNIRLSIPGASERDLLVSQSFHVPRTLECMGR